MPLEKQQSFEDSFLWKLKLQLQFSGWLQYIVHAVLILITLVIAGVGWLIGFWPLLLVYLPLAVAGLLTVGLIGTIIMVKYGFHPAERVPDRKHLDAFDLMRSRHSCRSFQPQNLTKEHHQELMGKVTLYSQQSQLLGKSPIRFEYVAARLTVWPVVGAHEFLVAIAPRKYNHLSIVNVGRSLQKIVLDATAMGLGTCWIGPGADQKSIIQHLGDSYDSKQDHVICVCAIGYESMFKPALIRVIQKLQHKRIPLNELFFSAPDCNLAITINSKPFSEYGRCYEVCQWSPSSYNGQTTRCAAIVADGLLVRFDFLTATHSRYYAPVALGIWCANWEIGCAALGKNGHFEDLSSVQRDCQDAPELPNYYISWVVD